MAMLSNYQLSLIRITEVQTIFFYCLSAFFFFFMTMRLVLWKCSVVHSFLNHYFIFYSEVCTFRYVLFFTFCSLYICLSIVYNNKCDKCVLILPFSPFLLRHLLCLLSLSFLLHLYLPFSLPTFSFLLSPLCFLILPSFRDCFVLSFPYFLPDFFPPCLFLFSFSLIPFRLFISKLIYVFLPAFFLSLISD